MAEPTPETAAEDRAATTPPSSSEEQGTKDAKARKAEKVTADDAAARETSPKVTRTRVVEEKAARPTVTVLERFLKKSGYSINDVDGYNERSRIFGTTNGGKYHLNKAGEVRILKGPRYPHYTAEGIGE